MRCTYIYTWWGLFFSFSSSSFVSNSISDRSYKTIVSFKYALKGEAMHQKIRGRWQPRSVGSSRPSIRAKDIQHWNPWEPRKTMLNAVNPFCFYIYIYIHTEKQSSSSFLYLKVCFIHCPFIFLVQTCHLLTWKILDTIYYRIIFLLHPSYFFITNWIFLFSPTYWFFFTQLDYQIF